MLTTYRAALLLGCAALLALLALLAAPGAARACGVWRLHDHEADREVTYYIHTTLVRGASGRKGPTLTLHFDGSNTATMFLRVGRTRELDLRGNAIRRRGRTIGTIAGDELRLGRSVYAIKIEHRPPSDGPEVMRWWVEVRRGEQLVADGQAMALCLDGPPSSLFTQAGASRETDEIRRRVIFYLAWRDAIARLAPGRARAPAPAAAGKKGLRAFER